MTHVVKQMIVVDACRIMTEVEVLLEMYASSKN